MEEIWKDIPNTPHHQISNQGRLRATKAFAPGGKSGTPHFIDKYHILHPSTNNCGYSQFVIRGKLYLIHRLVAEAFIPNPLGLSDVDHISGDKTDNSVSNLQWLSHADNMKKYGEYLQEIIKKRKLFLSTKIHTESTTHRKRLVFIDGILCEELSGKRKTNPLYKRIASGRPITIGKYAGKDIRLCEETKKITTYKGPSKVSVKIVRKIKAN